MKSSQIDGEAMEEIVLLSLHLESGCLGITNYVVEGWPASLPHQSNGGDYRPYACFARGKAGREQGSPEALLSG